VVARRRNSLGCAYPIAHRPSREVGWRDSGVAFTLTALLAAGVLVLVALVPVARAVPIGTITEFSAGLKSNSGPASLVEAYDGNLWFTDDGNTPAIGRITPSGEIQESRGPMTSPQLLVVGPDGYLWFSDNDAIGRISLDGTIAEFPFATDLDAHVGGEGLSGP
jgi:streptogramin lyase